MSSEKGNGVLEKHEIAKALRLMGWVQAGEILTENLLAVGVYVYFLGGAEFSLFFLWDADILFLFSGTASDFGWDNE
jgi:hypothetical protein